MSLRGRGAARVVSGPRSWSTARSLGSESLSGAGNKSRKPPPGRAPRRPPAAPAPRPGAADHGLWRQGNAGGDEPDSVGAAQPFWGDCFEASSRMSRWSSGTLGHAI